MKNSIRADFHMHTYFSYDCMVKPEELVKRAKEVDLGLIAITDHNSIEGAIAAKEISTIPVIIGEEIKSTEGEITGLFLQEYIEPGLSPIETAKRIKAQGALVSIPHPFTGMGRSSLSRSTVESLLSYVDIVERFNARTSSKSLNNEAEDFSITTGIPSTAVSDSHTLKELGSTFTMLPEFELNPENLMNALQEATYELHSASFFVHFASTFNKFQRRIRGWN